MNLQLYKIDKHTDFNINSLSNYLLKENGAAFYKKGFGKFNVCVNSPKGGKKVNYVESFERKFQLRYLLKTFNTLIPHPIKKRISNSVESKQMPQKLLLPKLLTNNGSKEFNNNESINYNNSNFINNESTNAENQYKFELPNLKRAKNKTTVNFNCPYFSMENQEDGQLLNSPHNMLEKSNSTLSQSLINSNNSKFFIENDTNQPLYKNISHGSIFDFCKNKYMSSVKDYKMKNKLAEQNFNEQISKLRQEKVKKGKGSELFKEFGTKFDPKKLVNKLRKEFNFFQEDNDHKDPNKKKSDNNYLNINKMFIAFSADGKTNSEKNSLIRLNLKPSRRIIRTMIRKDKINELIEKNAIEIGE